MSHRIYVMHINTLFHSTKSIRHSDLKTHKHTEKDTDKITTESLQMGKHATNGQRMKNEAKKKSLTYAKVNPPECIFTGSFIQNYMFKTCLHIPHTNPT